MTSHGVDFHLLSGVPHFAARAGGFGLNLTAASCVVLYDPWWNPAVENQAIDRTHRIGQTSHVIAYRLLVKDSIEENFTRTLTLDDFRFLFAE